MQIYKAFSCGLASNLKDHILDANTVIHWHLAQLKRVNWITKLKTVHWEIQLDSRQKLREFHCWWLRTSKLQVMTLSGEIYKRETNPRRILIWMFTQDLENREKIKSWQSPSFSQTMLKAYPSEPWINKHTQDTYKRKIKLTHELQKSRSES